MKNLNEKIPNENITVKEKVVSSVLDILGITQLNNMDFFYNGESEELERWLLSLSDEQFVKEVEKYDECAFDINGNGFWDGETCGDKEDCTLENAKSYCDGYLSEIEPHILAIADVVDISNTVKTFHSLVQAENGNHALSKPLYCNWIGNNYKVMDEEFTSLWSNDVYTTGSNFAEAKFNCLYAINAPLNEKKYGNGRYVSAYFYDEHFDVQYHTKNNDYIFLKGYSFDYTKTIKENAEYVSNAIINSFRSAVAKGVITPLNKNKRTKGEER